MSRKSKNNLNFEIFINKVNLQYLSFNYEK